MSRLIRPSRFQSSRPVRGATAPSAPPRCRRSYFNPRAPCGARRSWERRCSGTPCDFNPRAPCGARRRHRRRQLRNQRFQSSRPLRGATPSAASGVRWPPHFNPRAPCGARRPQTGEIDLDMRISILAPLAGRDEAKFTTWRRLEYFNPRAPCGARPRCCRAAWSSRGNFNPRAPCGARQQKCTKIACVFAITDKGQMLFPLSSAVCQDARSGSRRKQRRNPVRTVPKIPYACSSHYRIIGSSGRYVCLQPKCSILLSYFFPR